MSENLSMKPHHCHIWVQSKVSCLPSFIEIYIALQHFKQFKLNNSENKRFILPFEKIVFFFGLVIIWQEQSSFEGLQKSLLFGLLINVYLLSELHLHVLSDSVVPLSYVNWPSLLQKDFRKVQSLFPIVSKINGWYRVPLHVALFKFGW